MPKWIVIAASITTLSIPFFYIFGYAYDQGYLHAYGISNEFFSRSLQEYLVLSFFACLSIATSALDFFAKKQLLLIVIALIIGCITLFFVFVHKHNLDKPLHSKSASIKGHWLFDYIFFPVVSSILAFTVPLLLVTAISIILLIPAIAYFKGQSMAETEIADAKTCAYSSVPTEECVFLLENSKSIASGRLVARSQTHIALFNQGKTSIYPVKDQLIEVVPPSKKPNIAAKRDSQVAPPLP